jgi:phage terminase large subunit-like protein
MALSKPGIHVGICAPKYEDVRAVLIEGESGILAEARRNGIEIGPNAYNKNRQEIELDNGSKIRGFSAEKPDSIRGQNLSYCWFDELAMIRYFQFYHEGLMPALRKGDKPRMMITTTPKRVRLIRELLEEAAREDETGVHLTEASSEENIHFSRAQRERLERKYAGTYMLEQELKGRLVGEVDGCLFPIEQFNETRVYPDKDALPQWRRVVVAIDPATTSSDSSDESGICVAAEGADGDFYILEDCSGRYAPDQQMRVVAEAFYRHDADCVVGEVNSTGDYMRALLNTVDPNIPLRTVHGLKGKVARAQGPSSLFMQSRVHMVGDNFTKLEEQLSAFTEGDDRSRMKDDRADACLAEGTLVLTARGEIPIEQVVPGDLAWTRAGWKPVTAARCTQRNAEVLTVLLSDGRELTGTGDHRIWTENRGWQRLDALLWGDILSGWSPPHKSSIKAALTGAIPTALAGTIGSTISAGSRAVSSTCIATSGATRIRARKFRPAGTSTTMMRILSTTIRPIWFSSRRLNIPRFIRATSPGRKRTFSTTSTESALSLPSGIAPTRGMHGMSSMARTAGRTGSGFQPGRARSAGPGSSLTGTGRSGVRNAASSAPATATRSIWRLSPARRATSSSSATSTASDPGRALVSVLGSCASGERRDVYDLTVADVHEFTASGVIVHNCVWALIHLAGSNQGDWGIVYGFRDCTKCGSRVNEDKDQRCGNCGAEVNPLPPKHAGGRPPREPWSVAYLRECPNGHRYTPRERSCPECAPSPETYLAKALSMSAPGGGRFGYTGRDILRGRRI